MKNILRRHPKLKQLVNFTDKHLSPTSSISWGKQEVTSSLPSNFAKKKLKHRQDHEQAAITIQRAWRRKALVNGLANSPYATYLSMVDGLDKPLSALMFGRRIAELDKVTPDYIKNPFAHQIAGYHRLDDLSGPLMNHLLDRFGVSKAEQQKNYYIPVVKLQSTPLESVIKSICQNYMQAPKILTHAAHSIELIVMPKSMNIERFCEFLSYISVHGLVASPWEITLNSLNMNVSTLLPKQQRTLGKHFPRSRDELLASDIYSQLKNIAHDTNYPTHHLAKCLMRLLQGLPDADEDSIQRIATLLDATNTMYAYSYSKYAFTVYAIIHEISLIVLHQHNKKSLDTSFFNFEDECKHTFLRAYHLEPADLDTSAYLAVPATCGSNAFVTAIDIAKNMKTQHGKPPMMKYCNPFYFEFENITDSITAYSLADVFIISAGPMVTLDGLTPGIDINKFVKRHIIDTHTEKPITLVIDATTTLYKNLALTPEVKQLVKKGQLSIILFESHQKFGLLHSDQAQYGRVFAMYSTLQYPAAVMKQYKLNAATDFQNHLDMRIGAYINIHCRELLEEVKQAHFDNGAIIKDTLQHCNLIYPSLMQHDSMLLNQNENYFVTAHESLLKLPAMSVLAYRASFGHFSTTISSVGEHLRISPHASDKIDGLIDALQLSLAKIYTPRELLLFYINDAQVLLPLSLSEQIVTVAIVNTICKNYNPKDVTSPPSLLKLYGALAQIDRQCHQLRGRDGLLVIHRFQQQAREALSLALTPQNTHDFFEAIKVIYQQGIMLDQTLIDLCVKNYKLCKAISQYSDIKITQAFIVALAEDPERITQINALDQHDRESLIAIKASFGLTPQEVKRHEFITAINRIALLPASSLPDATQCTLVNGTLPQQLRTLLQKIDHNTLTKRPQLSWLHEIGIKNSTLSAYRTIVAERLIARLQDLLKQYQEIQQAQISPQSLYLLEVQALHLLRKAKEANHVALQLFGRSGLDKAGSLNRLLNEEIETISAFRHLSLGNTSSASM